MNSCPSALFERLKDKGHVFDPSYTVGAIGHGVATTPFLWLFQKVQTSNSSSIFIVTIDGRSTYDGQIKSPMPMICCQTSMNFPL